MCASGPPAGRERAREVVVLNNGLGVGEKRVRKGWVRRWKAREEGEGRVEVISDLDVSLTWVRFGARLTIDDITDGGRGPWVVTV